MHDTNSDLPIYRDHAGDGDELRRAMSHACVGLRPDAPLAFLADTGEWQTFYREVFSELIAPHFIAAYNAAVAGETERVITLDQEFASRISPESCDRLADAAAIVFDARSGAGAMHLLKRLRQRHPDCTFTTAFAAHAAGFHVPLLHALIAYLAVEWRSGQISTQPLEKSADWQKMFEQELLAAPEPVRQVLARNLCGWADVA